MGFSNLFKISNIFSLLIAPPAWGKTTRLIEWFEKSNLDYLLYVSPLRALANEVNERFSEYFYTRNLRRSDVYKFRLTDQREVLVITPEIMSNNFLEYLEQSNKKGIIILDEFHLYDHWSSFRPKMREVLEELSILNLSVFALTATMGDRSFKEWKEVALLNFDHVIKVNLGNYQLKYLPEVEQYSLKKKWVLSSLKYEVTKKRGTLLCFCAYRNEVKQLTKEYQENGYNSLGCVGGESLKFIEQLKAIKKPDVIFSTLALSHGVNLPSIRKVYFTYWVENKDYRLQMIARGGRNGEPYDVEMLKPIGEFKAKDLLYSSFVGYIKNSYQQLMVS